jgi:hypothetical protein
LKSKTQTLKPFFLLLRFQGLKQKPGAFISKLWVIAIQLVQPPTVGDLLALQLLEVGTLGEARGVELAAGVQAL